MTHHRSPFAVRLSVRAVLLAAPCLLMASVSAASPEVEIQRADVDGDGVLDIGLFIVTSNDGAVHRTLRVYSGATGMQLGRGGATLPWSPDVDHDGMVDARDVELLVRAIAHGDSGFDPPDVNFDGVVDINDLEIVLRRFGQPQEGHGQIPCEFSYYMNEWVCPDGLIPVQGPWLAGLCICIEDEQEPGGEPGGVGVVGGGDGGPPPLPPPPPPPPPGCGADLSILPTYAQSVGPINCGSAEGQSNFGLFTVETDFWQGEFTACPGEDGNWRLLVESFTMPYSLGVCPLGRVEVFTAWDPIVVAPTYCAILDDFAPAPAALYELFIASPCVTKHEEKHRDEWIQTFNQGWSQGFMNFPALGQQVNFEAYLESITVPISAQTPTPSHAVAAMMPEIELRLNANNDLGIVFQTLLNWPTHNSGPGGADQSQAYPVENACLNLLNLQIQSRANAEGWAPCNGE